MASRARNAWRERVARWRASGLTARAFCEREKLNEGTLRHYAWRLGREEGAEQPRFVEVTAAMPVRQESFEVKLRNGHRLRVPTGFDPRELGSLLSLLVR